MPRDHKKSDDRSFNLSLMASILVVVVFLVIELVTESVMFLSGVNELAASTLTKVTAVIILGLWLSKQHKRWEREQRHRP